MVVYELDGKRPQVAESAFVHPMACVIGDVVIGERVFVAPFASVRGDRGRIEIGDGTNVQDGVVVHSDPSFVTRIGRHVNIAHNAVVHAEYVGDHAAIGMGAVLMLGSRVAEGAIIGNGALLRASTVTEPYKVYVGVPARYLRDSPPDDPARTAIERYVESYAESIQVYKRTLIEVD